MISKPQEVLRALRDDIISGRISAGERLKEDELAAQHGVSRVPVREALRQLESEGFVVTEKYRGATVAPRSAQHVVELMQVRRGLEVLAAQLAATRHGGAEAEMLREVVERGRRAGSAGEVEALPPLIMEFHELVARASGNDELARMLDQILQRIAWGFEQEIVGRIQSSWADHAAVASAILSGSSVQAGYLMDEHILKDEVLYLRSVADVSSANVGPHVD